MPHEYNAVADMAIIGSLFVMVLFGMLVVKIRAARQPKPRGATRV